MSSHYRPWRCHDSAPCIGPNFGLADERKRIAHFESRAKKNSNNVVQSRHFLHLFFLTANHSCTQVWPESLLRLHETALRWLHVYCVNWPPALCECCTGFSGLFLCFSASLWQSFDTVQFELKLHDHCHLPWFLLRSLIWVILTFSSDCFQLVSRAPCSLRLGR